MYHVNNYLHWRPRRAVFNALLPPPLRSWLDTPGSMTARIRANCRECFQVRVLAEGWRRPRVDEARRLRLPLQQEAWVRIVTLNCGETPWILGRTVMPQASLRGGRGLLRRLGARALGAVLFTGREVERSEFELRRLQAADPLLPDRRLVEPAVVPQLWARRSVLSVAGAPILVTEVFLPELEYGAAYRQNLD